MDHRCVVVLVAVVPRAVLELADRATGVVVRDVIVIVIVRLGRVGVLLLERSFPDGALVVHLALLRVGRLIVRESIEQPA
jgi:hypothetical protein